MSSSSTPNQSANTSCVDRRANRPHILRAYSHAILKHFRAPAGQPRLSAQNLPGATLPITCLAQRTIFRRLVMNIHPVTPAWRCMRSACVSATFALALAPLTLAQTQPAETHPGDAKPADVSQTFFLAHVTEQREVNDILTDLRNMLPHAHSYAVAPDHAVTVKGSPDDIAEAQRLIAELDKPRKSYRL